MSWSPSQAFLLIPLLLAARATTGPSRDTSGMDADGTVRVSRVVPVPPTISPEAQGFVRRPFPDEATPTTTPTTAVTGSTWTEDWRVRAGRESAAAFPVGLAEASIAGVPVRDVTPGRSPSQSRWPT